MIKARKSLRLKNYNYSQNGMYFVTICTYNKKCFFGKVIDDEVKLNQCGKIVQKCFLDIPNHNNIFLDEFVIMPNHIHGIIEIVGDGYNRPLQQRSAQVLPDVMKCFKGGVTREVNKKFGKNNFKWQRSYYDHIIRKEKSLQKIQEYIIINPREWKKDELFIET